MLGFKSTTPNFKFDLQISNLPSRSSINPLSIKLVLFGSNLPSNPQICFPSLNSTLQPSNIPLLPYICHLQPYVCPLRTSRNSPCILQDIDPLGLLPGSHFTFSLTGHRVPLTMCDPWMTKCVCHQLHHQLQYQFHYRPHSHLSTLFYSPEISHIKNFSCSGISNN